jgi:hypothetical protein
VRSFHVRDTKWIPTLILIVFGPCKTYSIVYLPLGAGRRNCNFHRSSQMGRGLDIGSQVQVTVEFKYIFGRGL